MVFEILIGFVLLVFGGDTLVKGAVAVARKMGLSELLIGLTLVGMGTSTPELVTNVQSALVGVPDLAVGNIIGSNIANILLVLGVAAMIYPIACPKGLLKRDGIWLNLSLLIFVACEFLGYIPRQVGMLFVFLLCMYVFTVYRQERVNHDASALMHEHEAEAVHPWFDSIGGGFLLAFVGIIMTIFGAKFVVHGATELALSFGISELVVGMTVVALGTSLPELVTAVVAAWRRSFDVALGSVIGSNISNLLLVLGVTTIVQPLNIPNESMLYDIPMLVATTVMFLFMVRSGHQLSRLEGAFFTICYVGYMTWSIYR